MHDFRFALRQLVKNPAFAVIAISTFALGIGANTAVFSVVNAVLLRPLPFTEPGRLVALQVYDPRLGPTSNEGIACSYPDFEDWRSQSKVIEKMAVYTNQGPSTLTDGGEATHVQGEAVSAELFALLRVQPMLGRAFLPNEDEPGNRVVILSHAFWQRRFGGERDIVGKTLTFDGEKFQVVGVMPAGFEFPIGTLPPEVWTTMSMLRESSDNAPPITTQRNTYFLHCLARLKANVSLSQAQANIDTISAALQKQYPDSNTNTAVRVVPLVTSMVSEAHSALLMLCAMAGCVLLVACVNVVNLLLARSVSRQKEISIRTALGAGRWQIVKQLVSESAILAGVGGVVGLLFAIWAVDSLKAFLPSNIPRMSEVSTDYRVLGFTLLASVLAALLAGVFPAWRASHADLVGAIHESARGSTEGAHSGRTRSLLVVAEIVLAVVLLASAGLLIQSFLRLHKVDPGFDPTHVVTARVAVQGSNYSKPEQIAEFYKKLFAHLSVSPGIESAAGAWWIPLSGSDVGFTFNIEERPVPQAQQPVGQANVVTPEFFKTLGVSILRGRTFTERDDRRGNPVAVVTESFARQFFPGQDPIGKRIIVNGSDSPGDPPKREIVGVVRDLHLISLGAAPKPQMYIPHQQFGIGTMSIFLRTRLSTGTLGNTLRAAIDKIDKDVPVYRVRPLPEYVSQSIAQPRLNAMLVGLFAFIALLLAAAGIFGVMSYSVTQRTQEIGIRLALGAQRGQVLSLILSHGMKLVGIGLVVGIAGVMAVARVFQALLYRTGVTDVPTILGVSALLVFVAFLACWWPARRASAVDPIVALRTE